MLFNNAEMDKVLENTNINKKDIKRYPYRLGAYDEYPKTKGELNQLKWIDVVISYMTDLKDIIAYLNENCDNKTKRQVANNLNIYFYVDIIKRS